MTKRNGWFFVNLGDANLSQSRLYELEDELNRIYTDSGEPESMLAVYRHESRALHCQISVFLTGDFQRVASLGEATPCSEPHPNSVNYLAGNRKLRSQR